MFKLKTPCKTCPFKKGQGSLFQLHPERLEGIFAATAFQCHKTVDYSADDLEGRAGDHPQQCAGLMGVLHLEGRPNQIMQVGERFGAFKPQELDTDACYQSIDEAMQAHAGNEP